MKRLLVLSDSHHNNNLIGEIIERIKNDIEGVVFLGDVCDDIDIYKYVFTDLDYYCVAGNCDYRSDYPSESIIEFHGKKILLTHGHRYSVKSSYSNLIATAVSNDVNICLFGHTHEACIFEEQGIYFMNPGSISLPKGTTYKTYGIINIKDTKAELGDAPEMGQRASKEEIELSVVGVHKNRKKIILCN